MAWWDKPKEFLLGSKPIGVDQSTLRNDAYLQEQYKQLIGAVPGQQQLDRQRIDMLQGQLGGTVNRMQGLEGGLQSALAGRGGAGTMAAERNLLNQQRGIQSMAASARGLTAGAAVREAAKQNAILAAEGAGQIGQVRAQEQEQAMGQLQALLGQQAGIQGQQAGLEAGLAGTNLQAQLEQQQRADQLRLAGLSGLQGLDEAEIQRRLAILQGQQKPGALGAILTTAGTIIGAKYGGATGAQAGGALGAGLGKSF